MKETHFFYVSDPTADLELPESEAGHAVRVLRLQVGEEITLVDGKGMSYQAVITLVSAKHCRYVITGQSPLSKSWNGRLHLAVAPTKNMDRMEWLAEKATEIGLDELSFVQCDFSERKILKTERIDKIVVSAMKQSHKAVLPQVHEMVPFTTFLHEKQTGQKFIAHCYEEASLLVNGCKPFLADVLGRNGDATVLIGPEGDFSIDEVKAAMACGFVPVSLSESRLRTETAALVAVHLMNLRHRKAMGDSVASEKM